MTESTLINTLRNAALQLPEVRLVLLFGSGAVGSLGRESDIDLAVLCRQRLTVAQHMQLVGDVAELTGRAVDVVDLAMVGEPLLGQVLQHGQRVYGSDAEHAALINRHWVDTADFLPYAQRIVNSRRAAWTGL